MAAFWLASLKGKLPGYCHLLLPSLLPFQQAHNARLPRKMHSLQLSSPRMPASPGIILYTLHTKPKAISLSKFKSLWKDLKKKIPLVFLEALCAFFPLLAEGEGKKERCFQFTVTQEHFRASAPNPGRHQRPALTAAALSGGD